MEEGTGLSPFREAFPERFFDVGIAEEHAVTFAAGIAAQGLRPVAAIYSTFIQRAADQIIHDVCFQNLPVVFALDRSGLVSEDGETHQGIFDISLFRSVPNMTILAPAGEEELFQFLRWALECPGPVIIRYPKTTCPSGDPSFSLPLEMGRGVWVRRVLPEQFYKIGGKNLCLVFTGSLYKEVLDAAFILKSQGVEADIYNLRFLKPLDEDYFVNVLNQYKSAILVEEGNRRGGFGEYISELALRKNCPCRLMVLGVEENFDALGTREELLQRTGLDGHGIAEAALKLINRGKNHFKSVAISAAAEPVEKFFS